MTKRKVEIDVVFPDCELCGKCIEEDEKAIEFNIEIVGHTCDNMGRRKTGVLLGKTRLNVCKSCATNGDITKQALQEKVNAMRGNWLKWLNPGKKTMMSKILGKTKE